MSTHQQARGEKRVGTTIHRDRLDAVRAKRTFLAAMPDSDFYQRARAMRNVVQHLNRLSVDEAEVFAVVCEVARRRLALDPFDVQVLAGFVLADEAIVELGTGEGKTLAAVAPACLAAIRGRNVHILTFNDYLARRDAAWMRPIYEALGLSVAVVGSSSCFADRRRAYTANVVYVTARQAGFDFLRDHRARTVDEVVLRSLDYAIVDEVDDAAETNFAADGGRGRLDND